jgi:hypothetical protein
MQESQPLIKRLEDPFFKPRRHRDSQSGSLPARELNAPLWTSVPPWLKTSRDAKELVARGCERDARVPVYDKALGGPCFFEPRRHRDSQSGSLLARDLNAPLWTSVPPWLKTPRDAKELVARGCERDARVPVYDKALGGPCFLNHGDTETHRVVHCWHGISTLLCGPLCLRG